MILDIDASDYIMSSILIQKHPHLETGKSILYPVVFMLEKMSPAKYNYGIGDKQLLAITLSLEEWHIYKHQLPQAFTIVTDYYNLQTFTTKSLLSRHQV